MNNFKFHNSTPLVSVIIPCYNHGILLSEAVESVLKQSYSPIEIIVVNDGSSDNTKEQAKIYPSVKYFYQENQGLSSARNLGISKSTGELMVFLDADDLLYHDSIEYRVKYLLNHPNLAFVSGAHQVETMDGQKISQKKEQVEDMHYQNFLKGNYIGMHATVMYRNFIFDEFKFDSSLKACEDYDLYLKISRKYPVAHVGKLLAIYRKHENNMSGNLELMLHSAVKVLAMQEDQLSSKDEKSAYKIGLKSWKKYFTDQLLNKIRIGLRIPTKEDWDFIKTNNPLSFYEFKIKQVFKKNTMLKRFIPEFIFRLIQKIGFYNSFTPSINNIDLGDLERLTPFSKSFGYDRGGPIDRYYIERFLEVESNCIRGRVLEIGDNDYTLRYGKEKVVQSEILHVNDNNPKATIIGDLSKAPHIADNSFDCIILTQTLHLVYDYKAVINTCHRILKPGGSLLLTVPGITPIDYHEWGSTWYWSFTGLSIKKILSEIFIPDHTEVQTIGNVYAATTFLYGMGLPEVKKKKLDFNDPNMQVIVSAKSIKELLT